MSDDILLKNIMNEVDSHYCLGNRKLVSEVARKYASAVNSDLNTVLATGIELEVVKDIEARQQIGIKKYGITVDENPLTLKQWLQHAYEEHLDACIYLRKAIKECG